MSNISFITRLNELIISTKDSKMNRALERLLKLRISSFDDIYKLIKDTNRNVKDRNIAIWAIGRLKVKRTARFLLEVLKSNDRELWPETANSLGLLNSKTIIDPLIEIMLNDKTPTRKIHAAYALTYIRDRKIFNAFLRIVNNTNEHADLRAQALEGIAYYLEFRSSKSVLTVLRELLKDKNVKIRFWAIFAVGTAKDRSSLPILKNLIRRDKSVCPGWWSIRKEANNAVYRIKTGNWPDMEN